jgi:hypothetical protein
MKLITESDTIPLDFTGIVESSNGDKSYYVNGELHRTDGPAVEYSNGDKEYWINDLQHRIDGPAVEHCDGYKEYWINGERLTKEQFDNRSNSCHGKTVEIDGKKYKLTLVKD